MKCYCIKFDLNKRSSKTVYVSKNSTFQIGIKCYKDGELLAGGSLNAPDGTALTSSGTLADYTTWTLTSGAEEAAEQYIFTAQYAAGDTSVAVKLPPLTIITTSSDVAEIQAKEDLSDYYTKEEVDTKVSDAIAPLAPTSSLSAYWQKDETEEHQLTGTYEDGSEFSLTAICKKA